MHNLPPLEVVRDRKAQNEPVKLPFNIEAEQAILGSVLENNAVLDACPWLTPDDFFEPVHGRIWAECQLHHGLGQTADAVALKGLFEDDASLRELDGARYLARLAMAASTIVRAADYARLVKRLSRLRELHRIGTELAARVLADSGSDPATIWSDYAQQIEELLVDDSRPVARHILQVAEAVVREIADPKPLWSTGVQALDDSLGGGIPPGYVIGFEARPKQFKSGCAHTVLLALAKHGVSTTYFAYEMGAERLVKRMLGQLGGYNSSALRFNDATSLGLAEHGIRKLLGVNMWLADSAGWKLTRLKAAANQLLLRYGVKVFVLDFWQLVARDDQRENKPEFLAEVAQWCADHAHQHGTTWILCSQHNRTGESYGSDGLAKACDWLAVLHKHQDRYRLGEDWVETIWMEVVFARDGSGASIGTKELPVLYIHPHGPHLAQLSGT